MNDSLNDESAYQSAEDRANKRTTFKLYKPQMRTTRIDAPGVTTRPTREISVRLLI